MSSSTRSPAAGRPVRRTRLLVPLIVLGVLGAAGALYLNHISARWVPDAEAKVRAARQLQAEQAFAEIERQARAQPQAVAPQLAYAQALADRQSFMAALLPAERAVQDDPRNA